MVKEGVPRPGNLVIGSLGGTVEAETGDKERAKLACSKESSDRELGEEMCNGN